MENNLLSFVLKHGGQVRGEACAPPAAAALSCCVLIKPWEYEMKIKWI